MAESLREHGDNLTEDDRRYLNTPPDPASIEVEYKVDEEKGRFMGYPAEYKNRDGTITQQFVYTYDRGIVLNFLKGI